MNLLSHPPGSGSVDIKDPRIRYTFVDVAMKLVNDGPMYGVLAVILVLTLRGTTSALESMIGMAIAMLARSRPPDSPDKTNFLRGVGGAAAALAVLAAVHLLVACAGGDVGTVSVIK